MHFQSFFPDFPAHTASEPPNTTREQRSDLTLSRQQNGSLSGLHNCAAAPASSANALSATRSGAIAHLLRSPPQPAAARRLLGLKTTRKRGAS